MVWFIRKHITKTVTFRICSPIGTFPGIELAFITLHYVGALASYARTTTARTKPFSFTLLLSSKIEILRLTPKRQVSGTPFPKHTFVASARTVEFDHLRQRAVQLATLLKLLKHDKAS